MDRSEALCSGYIRIHRPCYIPVCVQALVFKYFQCMGWVQTLRRCVFGGRRRIYVHCYYTKLWFHRFRIGVSLCDDPRIQWGFALLANQNGSALHHIICDHVEHQIQPQNHSLWQFHWQKHCVCDAAMQQNHMNYNAQEIELLVDECHVGIVRVRMAVSGNYTKLWATLIIVCFFLPSVLCIYMITHGVCLENRWFAHQRSRILDASPTSQWARIYHWRIPSKQLVITANVCGFLRICVVSMHRTLV